MRAAIIADDLTGACDAAARAALAGWRPRVVFRGAAAGDLVAVSTATRDQTPEEASKVVAEVTRALMARGLRPLFKKMDSTLRGPWAAEAAAMRAVTGAQIVAVCPAFPACGRIVRQGIVYCHGEVVGELVPALVAAGLLDAQIGDAISEQDLAAFVESVAGERRSVLWVGSAGLAQFALGNRDREPAPLPVAERWLVLARSSHPATQAQLEVARAAGIQVVAGLPQEFSPDVGLFLIGGATAEEAVRRFEAAALDIVGEALPGIAAGRLVGGRADGVPLLTKAGGFGGSDSIVRAIRACSP